MSKREKTKEEKQYSIKPVESIPPGLRLKESFYDRILDECMANTSSNIFEISVKGKNWKSVYAPIDVRIMKKRYPLRLVVRTKEGKLYLKKYDTFEDMLKDRKTHKKSKKTE
jgi:hypothetical protein